MNTEFKAGTLYKLSPTHSFYGMSDNKELIFLCTEKMYLSMTLPVHLLIDVDTGGLWTYDPKKYNYEEYLQ